MELLYHLARCYCWGISPGVKSTLSSACDSCVSQDTLELCRHPICSSACVLSCFSHVRLFATRWTVPRSSVHGTWQARILEWVATSFSRGLKPHLLLAGGSFTTSAVWEAPFAIVFACKTFNQIKPNENE